MVNFKLFSEEVNEYDLGDGYTLQRDSSDDMAKHYAVYSELPRYNMFFRKSFDVILSKFPEDEQGVFWILKDGFKIGGVCIEPNCMGDIFLIPPYKNEYEVLKRLKEILIYWSDETADIWTFGGDFSQINNYEALGFIIDEKSRWMIRPTEELNISFQDNFYVDLPKEEHTLEMANLIAKARNNNPALKDGNAERTAGWIKDYYFDENPYSACLHKASTTVYDKETKELVGVCLISLWEEWPLIGHIAVKPSYGGRGLGTNMIKRALSILSEEFAVLRLYVTIGNKAEDLYYNLGFLKGTENVSMKLKK